MNGAPRPASLASLAVPKARISLCETAATIADTRLTSSSRVISMPYSCLTAAGSASGSHTSGTTPKPLSSA